MACPTSQAAIQHIMLRHREEAAFAMGWMHGRVIGRVTPPREEAERVVAFALRGLGFPEA